MIMPLLSMVLWLMVGSILVTVAHRFKDPACLRPPIGAMVIGWIITMFCGLVVIAMIYVGMAACRLLSYIVRLII